MSGKKDRVLSEHGPSAILMVVTVAKHQDGTFVAHVVADNPVNQYEALQYMSDSFVPSALGYTREAMPGFYHALKQAAAIAHAEATKQGKVLRMRRMTKKG